MTFFFVGLVVFVVVLLPLLTRGLWPKAVIIQPYQRGVLVDRGIFAQVLEPGRYRIWPRQTLMLVDMRTQVLIVQGQEVLSEDGIPVKISVAGDWSVLDAKQYLFATTQPQQTLYGYAQAAVRDVMAGRGFEELMKLRVDINDALLAQVKIPAEAIGVRMERLAVRDVVLSGELKRVMAQQVTAQKEGLAALERARGETAALRNLANAARMLEENPVLIQLRALQTLEAGKGNTLVLGVNGDTVLRGAGGK